MPQLHKGKQWYIDFYAYDPVSGRMRRKKYMLNHVKTTKARLNMASLMIAELFYKLRGGWNPFSKSNESRGYTDFDVVVNRYREYVDSAMRTGTLKRKTAIDYQSRLRQLLLYISESNIQIKFICQFDTGFAAEFLDYLIYDKDVSATTRNNYRTWLSAFSTWLVERKYLPENPIEPIHMMREKDKFRTALTSADLEKLRTYLSTFNRPFYLACMMEYYTFIRPDELRYIKIGDIHIADQTIFISSEISKNRKGQSVALNDAILKIMLQQHVFEHPSQEYLFGHDLIPGPDQIGVNQFRLEWVKVRKALHFPDSYQFYSLKDSGIRDLANAEGIVFARDQARHSDVAVTNRYLKSTSTVHEATKHFKGEL
jgi:integrase